MKEEVSYIKLLVPHFLSQEPMLLALHLPVDLVFHIILLTLLSTRGCLNSSQFNAGVSKRMVGGLLLARFLHFLCFFVQELLRKFVLGYYFDLKITFMRLSREPPQRNLHKTFTTYTGIQMNINKEAVKTTVPCGPP